MNKNKKVKILSIEIEKPVDLIAISLHNIFSHRVDDEKFINLVKDWNKKIVLFLEPFYPLTIIFQGQKIKFKREDIPKADLKVKIEFNTMLEIAYGRLNPIMALLAGKIKIKGILKIKTILRFMKIFLDTMKIVAADPIQNYYELNKNLK